MEVEKRSKAQSMMAELEQMGFPVMALAICVKSPIVTVYNPLDDAEDEGPTGSDDDAPVDRMV